MTYYVSVDFDRPLAIRRHVKRLSDFRAKAGERYCVSRRRNLGPLPSFRRLPWRRCRPFGEDWRRAYAGHDRLGVKPAGRGPAFVASKPTGPRGRFFLSVFRDAWSVVIRPWSVVEAVEGPFSCTSHAGTRASVQSGRDPWAFGRAFHVVERSAAFGSGKWGRCRNNYTPAVVRGPWCAGRRPWFGGAGVWMFTAKQGPPAPSRGLWIKSVAASVPGTHPNPRPAWRGAWLWICG
jgi:hypothetical protein